MHLFRPLAINKDIREIVGLMTCKARIAKWSHSKGPWVCHNTAIGRASGFKIIKLTFFVRSLCWSCAEEILFATKAKASSASGVSCLKDEGEESPFNIEKRRDRSCPEPKADALTAEPLRRPSIHFF